MKKESGTNLLNREYDQLFRLNLILTVIAILYFVFFVCRSYAHNDQRLQNEESVASVDRSTVTNEQGLSDRIGLQHFLSEDFNQIQKQMDKHFENIFHSLRQDPFYADMQFPSVHGIQDSRLELKEEDNGYVAVIKLPNLDDAKLNIEVLNGQLTIQGIQEEQEEHQGHSRSMQRSFKHSISLPDDADSESFTTSYRDETLHIIIPKSGTDFLTLP